jgi:hypothetical protein
VTRSFIFACILLSSCLAATGCEASSQTAHADSQSGAQHTGSPPNVAPASIGAPSQSAGLRSQASGQAQTSLPSADSSPAQQSANQSSPLLEDVEDRKGPFRIGGQNYTVVMASKRIKGHAGPDPEALVSLEIRDSSGAVAHREKFDYDLEKGEFTENCFAHAELLKGSMKNYIMVSSECLPDAPGGDGPREIFGPFNGKLTLFDGPISTQGKMLRFVPGAATKNGSATQFGFDALEFKVWAGNFYVTVTVGIGMTQPVLAPGMHCVAGSGRGMVETGCDVLVEANRSPADQDTFVRMFDEARQGDGAVPTHVVIHKDSIVEFLAANARMVLSRSGGSISIDVDNDPWLKVRIDGKVGWIHTQEDFIAVGLPPSG